MFEGAQETKDEYLLWSPGMEKLECCGLNLESGTGLPEKSYSLELEEGYLQLSEELFQVDTLICDDYQIEEVWLCKRDGKTPHVGVRSEGFYSYGTGPRKMRRLSVWNHGQDAVTILDLIRTFLKRRESMQ